MRKILFTREAEAISDYEIEEAFLRLKDLEIIKISNEILLNRFRLAFLKGEFEEFELTVIDGNKTVSETIFFDGGFYNAWNVPVFNRTGEYCSKIIQNKEKEENISINDVSNIKTIIFSKDANKVSDFDIEVAYSKLKDLKEIIISNEVLLYRFRLAVSEKEIFPFNLLVKEDNKELLETSTSKGDFKNAWDMPILNLNLFYVSEIWKHLSNRERQKN